MADTTTTVFYSFGIIFTIVVGIGILYLSYTNFSKISNLFKFVFTYPFDIVLNLFKNNEPLLNAENCALYRTSDVTVPRVPSIFIAHLAFFFGFLYTNAYVVYNLKSQANADQTHVDNRKTRALMTMVVLALVYTGIVLIRYNMTGCESLLGVIFTSVVFGTFGYLTYNFAEFCGARNADILGIASGIYDRNIDTPVVCHNS